MQESWELEGASFQQQKHAALPWLYALSAAAPPLLLPFLADAVRKRQSMNKPDVQGGAHTETSHEGTQQMTA